MRAEADRRSRNEHAREEAAERLKRPFADADIDTIKDMTKQRRERDHASTGENNCFDILEFANTTDDIDSGYVNIVSFCCENDNQVLIWVSKERGTHD